VTGPDTTPSRGIQPGANPHRCTADPAAADPAAADLDGYPAGAGPVSAMLTGLAARPARAGRCPGEPGGQCSRWRGLPGPISYSHMTGLADAHGWHTHALPLGGRVEKVDRAGLTRLVASILRFPDPGDA